MKQESSAFRQERFKERELASKVVDAASEFPVIAIVGPYYAGKTTLAQIAFPNHNYVSFGSLMKRIENQ